MNTFFSNYNIQKIQSYTLLDQVGQTQGDIATDIQSRNKTSTNISLHYMVTYVIHNKHYKTTNYIKHRTMHSNWLNT